MAILGGLARYVIIHDKTKKASGTRGLLVHMLTSFFESFAMFNMILHHKYRTGGQAQEPCDTEELNS